METTNTGKVKFFNADKNFGFITDDASQKDIFVHSSNTLDRLVTDDLVEFNIIKGDRGLKCADVRRKKVLQPPI